VVQKGVVEVTLFIGYKGGTEGGSRSNASHKGVNNVYILNFFSYSTKLGSSNFH
jgi:hypothetical protein